jgi:hypothetical protein
MVKVYHDHQPEGSTSAGFVVSSRYAIISVRVGSLTTRLLFDVGADLQCAPVVPRWPQAVCNQLPPMIHAPELAQPFRARKHTIVQACHRSRTFHHISSRRIHSIVLCGKTRICARTCEYSRQQSLSGMKSHFLQTKPGSIATFSPTLLPFTFFPILLILPLDSCPSTRPLCVFGSQ